MDTNKPIYADRGWEVTETKGVPRLASTYAPDIWPVQGILDAECRCNVKYYTFTMSAKEMHDGHSCGIVGIKPKTINNEGMVKGQVGLFGRVREFERGYRAKHAFVTKLYTGITPCRVHWREEFTFSMFTDLEAFQNLPQATLMTVFKHKPSSPIAYTEPLCWDHRPNVDDQYSYIDYHGLLVKLAKYYHVPLVRWKDDNPDV